jgi:hypothetical protein
MIIILGVFHPMIIDLGVQLASLINFNKKDNVRVT